MTKPVIIINTVENDDWIKSLPGHKEELDMLDTAFSGNKVLVKLKGGKGSGNHGHGGRPGKIGGSTPKGGSSSSGGIGALAPSSIHNIDAGEGIYISLLEPASSTLFPQAIDPSYFMQDEIKAGDASSIAKDRAISTIAEQSGVPYDDVNQTIGDWATTSNDHYVDALATQVSAAEEFNVPISDWQKASIKTAEAVAGESVAVVESKKVTLRTMYNQTQQAMVDAGLGPDDTVTLYRGVTLDYDAPITFKTGETVNYKGNAIESWSGSMETARMFAFGPGVNHGMADPGMVVSAKVPIRNILSTGMTGFGCLAEAECVVFGSLPGSQVTIMQAGMGVIE